jgi:hypothetical protein
MSEIIELENSTDKYPDPDWSPDEGPIFNSILSSLNHFSPKEINTLKLETKSILGKCINPNEADAGFNTGVAIGHVQSGKTTSFTSLVGLALDNNFHFIIVLGGRLNSLLNQNANEISEKLENFEDSVYVFAVDPEQVSKVKQIVDLPVPNAKDDSLFFKSKKTVSINLKHYDHINKVAAVIEKNKNLAKHLNALIIDDEADNASLNNRITEEEQSSTYSAITRLRKSLPRHSFVQYTATPQAILLTSRNDLFNPDWVRFVSPGQKYIGTKEIFDDESPNIRKILPKEVLEQEIQFEDLPKSFLKALASYMLCVAESVQQKTKIKFDKKLTMMVHPSRTVLTHGFWAAKIKSLFENWQYIIDTNPSEFDKDYQELFKEAYADLSYSAKENKQTLSKFEPLFFALKQSIEHIHISALNAGNNKVKWKKSKYHIIVGGDLLDRGFVVKGLINTYMPRKISVNTDTLQQRGRFYGYKKDFQSVIRIFLTDKSKNAFKAYARTEEDLYRRLKQHLQKNKSLKSWKRLFLLDPSFEPCRRNVIGLELTPKVLNNKGWFVSRWPVAEDINLPLVQHLLSKYKDHFEIFNTHDFPSKNWTEITKSIIAENLPTNQVIADFDHFAFDPAEQEKWISVQTLLASMSYRKYKSAIIFIGTTDPLLDSIQSRKRGVTHKDGTFQLKGKIHQGKNEKLDYPGGDGVVASDDQITFQIHRFEIINKITNTRRPTFHLSIKLPKRETIIEETNLSFEMDYLFNNEDT